MSEETLQSELSAAKADINYLKQRVEMLEKRLPNTKVIDPSFFVRAFAIAGHNFVASLIIAIPFYILFFLLIFGVMMSTRH